MRTGLICFESLNNTIRSILRLYFYG
ncbi:hypothetical protein QR98_0103610 [Sarcoptes scabiei]|uniref:Uncharacterized protein n=1 Tax=Sarcoptes scabiei TaxID=52283 RepID=A0A132ALD8_SARSC|nr:hypothetical protein QR98_0103610 [Sarcoptes scabiei]